MLHPSAALKSEVVMTPFFIRIEDNFPKDENPFIEKNDSENQLANEKIKL